MPAPGTLARFAAGDGQAVISPILQLIAPLANALIDSTFKNRLSGVEPFAKGLREAPWTDLTWTTSGCSTTRRTPTSSSTAT
jgi:hypothetical protein